MRSPGECRAVVTVADRGRAYRHHNGSACSSGSRKDGRNAAGSGLGLAIVRELVHAHGGVVLFGSETKTTVRVQLPGVDG